MAYFVAIDYCILVGTTFVSLFIGIYFVFRKKENTSSEFLTGNQKMSVWPVVLSMLASDVSYNLIAFSMEVYTRGTQIFMTVAAEFVAIAVAAKIFLPIYLKVDGISVNQYLLSRFKSEKLVVITSLIMTISLIPELGVILFSPSLALGVATGMNAQTSILFTAAVVTLYTVFGGMNAIIYTDVVLFVLMMAGLFTVLIKGTLDVGGIGDVLQRNNMGGRIELFNFTFNPYMSNNIWTVILGPIVMFTALYAVDQYTVQRLYTLPNLRKIQKCFNYTLIGFIVIQLLVLYLGMVIYANYYDCDPLKIGKVARNDEIVTLLVSELFGNKYPGLLGLFVTCVFASSLSTLSSSYASLAALVWEDLIECRLPNIKPKVSVCINQVLIIVISAIVTGVAFVCIRIGSLFDAMFLLLGAPVGPLLAIFILGALFPNANAKGALSALIFGFVFSVWITACSMIYKNDAQLELLTSTEGCDQSFLSNVTQRIPLNHLTHSRIPEYYPTGMNLLYHISPVFMPVVTFLVTVLVGFIMSVITGNNGNDPVDPKLMWSFVNRFRNIKKEEINGHIKTLSVVSVDRDTKL